MRKVLLGFCVGSAAVYFGYRFMRRHNKDRQLKSTHITRHSTRNPMIEIDSKSE